MKREGIMKKDSHADADSGLLSDSVLFMLSPRSSGTPAASVSL